MAITVGGVEVGSVTVNGAVADTVTVNGVEAWTNLAPGSVTIDYDGHTFTGSGADAVVNMTAGAGTILLPSGVKSLSLCMCGGGSIGSGICPTSGEMQGGYAGLTVSTEITEGLDAEIAFVVADRIVDLALDGNPSTFGTNYALGGTGSVCLTDGYLGDGAEKVSCGGTFYDGVKVSGSYIYWGGEASAFANGASDGDGETTPRVGAGSVLGQSGGSYGGIKITW